MKNIVIKIVKNHFYTQETRNALIKELKNSLGHHNKITIFFVNEIEPEISGKHRFAISKVKNPYLKD